MDETEVKISGGFPVFSTSSPVASSAAGVELGKKAFINASSSDVWSPWNYTNSESRRETFRFNVNEILTVLSAPGQFWHWCDLNHTSAPCSVWPAASPLAELYEPSPNGRGRDVHFLAFSPFPSSTGAQTLNIQNIFPWKTSESRSIVAVLPIFPSSDVSGTESSPVVSLVWLSSHFWDLVLPPWLRRLQLDHQGGSGASSLPSSCLQS